MDIFFIYKYVIVQQVIWPMSSISQRVGSKARMSLCYLVTLSCRLKIKIILVFYNWATGVLFSVQDLTLLVPQETFVTWHTRTVQLQASMCIPAICRESYTVHCKVNKFIFYRLADSVALKSAAGPEQHCPHIQHGVNINNTSTYRNSNVYSTLTFSSDYLSFSSTTLLS